MSEKDKKIMETLAKGLLRPLSTTRGRRITPPPSGWSSCWTRC